LKVNFLNKIEALQDRAQMLASSRSFFEKRGVIEVDCPFLSSGAPVDPYIDLITAACAQGPLRYLHSSPEYAMKRLLAMGMGDIYQLCHVFRDDEYGRLHNPEFTMTEWYRLGIEYKTMITETLEYVELFLGPKQAEWISYREAFLQYAHVDYLKATEEELIDCLRNHQVEPYPQLLREGRDAILNVILAIVVEPGLREKGLCVLLDYPASQAALAKICKKNDELVAERFEIFFQGIELANGYHELTDAIEQRRRLNEANIKRQNEGRSILPIDEFFLKALEQGIPDCCGVAVGFDRLLMLRQKAPSLSDILPFGWLDI